MNVKRIILSITPVLMIALNITLHAMDCPYFDTLQTEGFLNDYNKLHEYLMENINKSTELFSWKNAHITANKHVFECIEQTARKTGNIVCLYMLFRNYFEYCTVTYPDQKTCRPWDALCYEDHKPHLNDMFSIMMELLMRITYDIINHYSKNMDATVFNTYYIMKQKMHLLLTDYASTMKYSDYPDFRKSINQALTDWKKNFTEKQSSFNCTWLKSFGWAHGWILGSRGIYFGPNNEPSIQSFNSEDHLDPKDSFEIVSIIFTQLSLYESWEGFFSSYYFPLTKEELSTWLLNKIQKKINDLEF